MFLHGFTDWGMAEWTGIATIISLIAAAYWQSRRGRSDLKATERKLETDAYAALRGTLADINMLRDQLGAALSGRTDCEEELARTKKALGAKLAELALAVQRSVELEATSSAVGLKLARGTPRLLSVLNHARDGIVLTLPEEGGRFVFVNTAFANALGYTQAEVIALGWRNLVHPADIGETQEAEHAAIGEGGITRNRYRHRDGHYVPLTWIYTPYEAEAEDEKSLKFALSVVWFDRRRTDSGPMAPVTEANN